MAVTAVQFPNGRYVHEDRDGTFSHQPPNDNWWCCGHATAAEAERCYQAQERALAEGRSASQVKLRD